MLQNMKLSQDCFCVMRAISEESEYSLHSSPIPRLTIIFFNLSLLSRRNQFAGISQFKLPRSKIRQSHRSAKAIVRNFKATMQPCIISRLLLMNNDKPDQLSGPELFEVKVSSPESYFSIVYDYIQSSCKSARVNFHEAAVRVSKLKLNRY